ncbi:MAG TPA: hypothetical protein PKY35_14310 [Candidatus Hydrogenedentes bacterium]|nr:hypothetical protein [Candidatus Hydrogenedentota bacterium]HOL78193.1 hypothetical protein [Candidatus Hydrogenedentota bacterium]HPO87208.1 hypothetical protein [Candidatus Hydrogenedentota bacterium]
MPAEITKCSRCGKLIAANSDSTLCSACYAERLEQTDRIEEAITRWNLQSPEEIATFAGMTPDEVREIIKETSLFRSKVDRRVPCRRCGEKPAQPDSDYCLDCRLELNRALGLAAGDLLSRVQKMAASMPYRSPTDNSKLVTRMDEIGKRVGSKSRGDFAPRNRYRSD